MTMSVTYLDEFIDKMYLVPNDINRHLRLIRTLDKKAQALQPSLNQLQNKFLHQLKEHKQSFNGTLNGSTTKKQTSSQTADLPTSLRNDYQKIVTKQKELYGFYREKYQVSQQLKIMVSDFYEQLDAELKNKMKQKTEEERAVFENRRKAVGKLLAGINGNSQSTHISTKTTGVNGTSHNSTNANNQFLYNQMEPKYCYCEGLSFGEMVECENPYCEREWFHVDCIQQKNLPDRWYCMNCQKQKDKTRNNLSRGFFYNRQHDSK